MSEAVPRYWSKVGHNDQRADKIEKIHPKQGAGEIIQHNLNVFLPWVPYWCASLTLDTFLVIWALRC